jgi:hypothetical protein
LTALATGSEEPASPPAASASRVERAAGKHRPGGFYGWRIVAFSAVAMAMTAPGQTTGVSLFTDPSSTT